jgi:RNase P subunit RPR2
LKSNVIKEKNQGTPKRNSKLHNHDSKSEYSSFEFPYKICLICDVYFNPLQVLILECNHIFCANCTKLFFEEKIEEGKKEIKCPLFRCPQIIVTLIVQKYVTEKHFNNFLKKLEINDEKLVNLIQDEKMTFNLAKKSTTFLEPIDFKNYSKKHVFEITSNISFLYYSKSKEVYCKNCNEEALFGKNCRNFIKCMNCLKTFCKYCGKNYVAGHFDFSGNNYCKIFFRRNCKYLPTVRNKFKEALSDFMVFILGYFVLILGVINYINLGVNSLFNYETYYYLKLTTHIILMIILTIMILPIMFVILPFYPSLVAIFR